MISFCLICYVDAQMSTYLPIIRLEYRQYVMVDDIVWGQMFKPQSDQQFLHLGVHLVVRGLQQQGMQAVHVLL